jgi:hypothetical protein
MFTTDSISIAQSHHNDLDYTEPSSAYTQRLPSWRYHSHAE